MLWTFIAAFALELVVGGDIIDLHSDVHTPVSCYTSANSF